MPPPRKSHAESRTALELDRYVPGLLTWLANKLAAGASQTYRDRFGIGVVEWRILSYLAVHGTGTGTTMSQLMGSDKSAMSRAAAFLLEKRLIRSQPGHARNVQFYLSERGRTLHDRIIQLALAREATLLRGLNSSEVKSLLRYLHILLANLEAVEGLDASGY